jgi:hypothetical protein
MIEGIYIYCHVFSDFRRALDWQLDLLDQLLQHVVTIYSSLQHTRTDLLSSGVVSRVVTSQRRNILSPRPLDWSWLDTWGMNLSWISKWLVYERISSVPRASYKITLQVVTRKFVTWHWQFKKMKESQEIVSFSSHEVSHSANCVRRRLQVRRGEVPVDSRPWIG